MPIEKGRDWGEQGELPPDAPVVTRDSEVVARLDRARRDGAAPAVIGLAGGDLCRTLGGRGDPARFRHGPVTIVPIDAVRATIDGVEHRFVAHLVARRRSRPGRVVAAMNAEFHGAYDVAPRAHPNDGLVDLLEADLSWRGAWQAWRRLPSGSHLPHPRIAVRRVASASLELDPPMAVWLDGIRVARRARQVELVVEPDAVRVAV